MSDEKQLQSGSGEAQATDHEKAEEKAASGEEERDHKDARSEQVPYMELFYSDESAAAVDAPERRAQPTMMDWASMTIETAPGQAQKHEMDSSEALEAGADDAEASEVDQAQIEQHLADTDWTEQGAEGSSELMEAEELNQVIEDICRSKAEEFRMIGYERVTGAEIWECVSDSYRKKGLPPLHRIVNDILTLKVTSFMNWMTMSVYRDSQR
ncbi:post-transcriptional regulator [Paenibacillus sp. YYML68]|uniref:post-transcriptional regulator n=1 Tax=Paenibacillus sp. YYML68 TaxID=2909250 RepID=UPI0028524AF2|nr:post-transcriptional regulator [Paenibacillus sp. YYML68]